MQLDYKMCLPFQVFSFSFFILRVKDHTFAHQHTLNRSNPNMTTFLMIINIKVNT